MTNYHHILEVPADASRDQIRAQYKQLVRIFHPDRFSSSSDKDFVEQKLKEINEAYHALLNPGGQKARIGNSVPLPQPIVLPSGLNFGDIPDGQESTLVFHVGNTGGPAHRFSLNCDEQNTWFRVTRGKRVNPSQPFPMEFAIVASTQSLELGQTCASWIDVHMDGVVKRIPLSVNVVEKRTLATVSPRIVLLAAMIIVALLAIAPRLFNFQLPAFLNSQQPVLALTPAASPTVLPIPGRGMEDGVSVNGGRSSLSRNDYLGGTTVVITPDILNMGNDATSNSAPANDVTSVAITSAVAETATPVAMDTPITVPPTELSSITTDASSALAPTEEAKVTALAYPWLAAMITSSAQATVVVPVATATLPPTSTPLPTVLPAATPIATTNTLLLPTWTTTAISSSTAITIAPTSTPTPQPASTRPPAPYGLVARVPNTHKVYVRSDISVDAEPLVLLDFGTEVAVIGRTYDSAWILVIWPDIPPGYEAWIFTKTVSIDTTRLEILPVVVPRSLNGN